MEKTLTPRLRQDRLGSAIGMAPTRETGAHRSPLGTCRTANAGRLPIIVQSPTSLRRIGSDGPVKDGDHP
jgi:hypothetical protein